MMILDTQFQRLNGQIQIDMKKHKHHIIPKHVGGTNDPSNIVLLTVEEHAEAHRKLYEDYGRWQDYVAWQGLSGRLGKEEIIQYKNRMAHLGKDPWNKGMIGYNAGKKHYRYGKTVSEETSNKISNTLKGNQCRAKKYNITNIITGKTKLIKNLKKFCDEENLPYKSVNRAIQSGIIYRKIYNISEEVT